MTDFHPTAAHTYVLCGLHTLSDIPLTGSPRAVRRSERVDILIQIATGPSPMAEKCTGQVAFEHSAECSLIRIKEVADFEVRQGRRIRVWPASRAAQKDIEIFLFGLAWATLCHQRGMVPLHASAILTRRGITAFAGHSGAGKSTTAALMGSLGYELVTDDILPISLHQNSIPGGWPYLRRLKLQRDPIIELALEPTELVSEKLDKEKYFVHPKRVANDAWHRLDRIYLLETDSTGSESTLDRITGAESVGALVDHTYHLNFVLGSGLFRSHLAHCAQVASKVPIYRLRRSTFSSGKELRSFICSHLD